MTTLDLTAVRARLDAVIYGRTAQSGVSPSEYLTAEAALIEHASDDIGSLLDHIDQLRAENQRLRKPAQGPKCCFPRIRPPARF